MKKLLNFISWVRSKTAHFIMELALYTIAFVIGLTFGFILSQIVINLIFKITEKNATKKRK